MAKESGYNFSNVILALVVCLMPTLGAISDEKAVTYVSLCLLWLAAAHIVKKNGLVVVTKSTVLFALVALAAFVQLAWVSDKGGQFYFASVFFAALPATVVARDCKQGMGERAGIFACRLVYLSATVYALFAVLVQIFVKSSLNCNMDLIHSSSAFTAIFMIAGQAAGAKLFYRKEEKTAFYASMVLMAYVFVMTKSLAAFSVLAVTVLYFAVKTKKKRTEIFFAMLAVGTLAVLDAVSAIVAIATGRVFWQGALRGIASAAGMGYGGYNAVNAVVDKAYDAYAPTAGVLTEAFGPAGFALSVGLVLFAAATAKKRKTLDSVFMFLSVITMLLTSSAALPFAAVLFAMYYAATEQGKTVKVHNAAAYVAVVPMLVFGYFALAAVPYALGKNAYDMGNYEKAQACYETAAKMEMFASDGWYRAYEAALKEYEENGTDTLEKQREYLEKAMKFNKANYKYKKLDAQIDTEKGRHKEALEIWNGIILRYDREYLYPEYAEKIKNVMEKSDVTPEEAEQLYYTMAKYAQKAENKDIKYRVNNILAESQKYYLYLRDGDLSGGDIYEYALWEGETTAESVTEDVTEENI